MTFYEECWFCKEIAEVEVIIPWGEVKWVCRRCISMVEISNQMLREAKMI